MRGYFYIKKGGAMLIVDYLKQFNFKTDRASAKIIDNNMRKNLDFYAPQAAILFCAIIIAAIGLNLGNTAVVIGAMLISPIMGPIQTIGYSIAIGDKELLKKAMLLLIFQVLIAVGASVIYFAISPLNEPTSEILARTAPTFWDVLIAIFGGFAGIIGVTRNEKSNVIPGVAIATALMPPLATVGFGIAHLNQEIILGALYLFIINSIFIVLTSTIGIEILQIRRQELKEKLKNNQTAKHLQIGLIVVIIPSIIASASLINEQVVNSNLNSYINQEIETDNRKVVSSEIDYEQQQITLIVVGEFINKNEIDKIEAKLDDYRLDDYQVKIIQNSYAQTTKTIIEQIKPETGLK